MVELTFLNGRAEARRRRRLLAAPVRQMSAARQARVRALAKINLDLRVLGKRARRLPRAAHDFPDHLAGRHPRHRLHPGAPDLDRARRTRSRSPITWWSRAARARAWTRCASPAASRCGSRSAFRWARAWAADRRTPRRCCSRCPCSPAARSRSRRCARLGQQLGSDVPFFLLGGTAAAIGRGTELFPLPDAPAARRPAGGPGHARHHSRGLPRA